ncbi:hydroxycarboxylic acid receptor 3-like [Osmerus eperlanus]|uniref:hydroxycarboxylic acid receptor 3-like n=1 Tax=Osmerus eperlanus TaxID=29151 RepID=UPI002E13FF7B
MVTMVRCVDVDLLARVLPPLLLLECVLGILGNSLALWIFCFHLKPWKSSTVFLFNLALADFLLNTGLPARVSYYLLGMDWRFGDASCTISLFMFALNRRGSILFLMAIAVDRYVRVVHPHHPLNSMSLLKASCLSVGLWILNASSNAHLLTRSHYFQTENSTQYRCESFTHNDELNRSMFILEFLLSLGIILFCSQRISGKLRARQLDKTSRICRVQRSLWVVTVMFIICFLPSNITRFLIWARNAFAAEEGDCDSRKPLETAFYITICLTYLNSMLDPVVYYFINPSFKRIYRTLLKYSLEKIRGDKKDERAAPALSVQDNPNKDQLTTSE